MSRATQKKNSKKVSGVDPFDAADFARAAALEDAKNEKYVGSQISDWIPYSERITAEDVGVGTIVPTAADDARLVPASAVLPSDEELDLHELFELGAGRLRVLSIEGRDQAAKRWIEGDRGPNAPIAQFAPKNCGSCGFYLPIAGSFRQAFGVCANAISPEDARVVSVNHGCGAHSEAIN